MKTPKNTNYKNNLNLVELGYFPNWEKQELFINATIRAIFRSLIKEIHNINTNNKNIKYSMALINSDHIPEEAKTYTFDLLKAHNKKRLNLYPLPHLSREEIMEREKILGKIESRNLYFLEHAPFYYEFSLQVAERMLTVLSNSKSDLNIKVKGSKSFKNSNKSYKEPIIKINMGKISIYNLITEKERLTNYGN